MGESQHQRQPTAMASRLGTRNTVGEIVEVQGGHIVRSTGRKDRHSKVCTAKGPRDRRVRLSAHTAIQFYDVQDRLGYDRPSKAVDWLIKKAKAAIDELDELPAWNPTTAVSATTTKNTTQRGRTNDERDFQLPTVNLDVIEGAGSGNTTTAAATPVTMATTTLGTDIQSIQQQQQHLAENPNSFLPPSLDSDAIADTIKSFFPMGAATETTVVSSSSIQFQSYPPDLLSRTSSQNQDLRLSLQSFQEPMLLHRQQQHHHGHTQSEQQIILSGTPACRQHLGYDAGWSEHHQNHPAEINRFQRMVSWNAAAGGANDTGGGGEVNSGGSGGFIFNTILPQTVPPPQQPPPLLQPLFGQNQYFSQRGPLQSSYIPSVRAWIDPAITAGHLHHHQTPISQFHNLQSAIPAPGFGGFQVPARIQGEEEDHDGIYNNKPSSVSSDSCH